ncbi:hypothetical protein ASD89_23445 [Caulobacter sp. Root656]|nr:hypothetical protein ASD89_23445 [Caulobacter sp. Root656]
MTIDTSHSSIWVSTRSRPVSSGRALTARKPIDRPSRGPGLDQGGDQPSSWRRAQDAAADVEARRVFLDLVPDADGLGVVVLVQHLDAGRAGAGQAGGEGPGGGDVVVEVAGPEQAGVTFDGEVLSHEGSSLETVEDPLSRSATAPPEGEH